LEISTILGNIEKEKGFQVLKLYGLRLPEKIRKRPRKLKKITRKKKRSKKKNGRRNTIKLKKRTGRKS
jgi:hypothetical protein